MIVTEFSGVPEYMGAKTKFGDFFQNVWTKAKTGSYGVQTPGGGFSVNKAEKQTTTNIPVQTVSDKPDIMSMVKNNLPFVAVGGLILFLVLKKR